MKKTLAMLTGCALCVGMLAACGGAPAAESAAPSAAAVESTAPASEAPKAESLSGSVVTNGSTSMEKVMGALIEGFNAQYPDVDVTYDPTGSGSGIEAATNGSADIGLSSRALKDEEKSTLTETVVAKDGIAIIVNPASKVEDLTVEQVTKIASGEIKDWSEVGGDAGAIAVVGREAGSGTRGAFEELTATTGENGQPKVVYSQELTSTGAVVAAVASTPGAIGYASLSSVNDTVKAVKIAGVECTEKTVLDGSYTIQRPFVFATKTDGTLSEAAQAFFDFATDAANAELYVAADVVPANG